MLDYPKEILYLIKILMMDYLEFMKFGKTGETYHFSNNDYYSIKDIILLICKIKKISFNKLVYYTKDRIGKDKNYYLNCKKTSKNLNGNQNLKLKKVLNKL